MTEPNPTGPLQSEYANDPEMTELVGFFLSELPGRIDGVVSAFKSGDADTLARLAHQIKGAAGGYGYPSVGEAAGKVEHGIRTASNARAAIEAVNIQVRELVDLCCRAADSSAGSGVSRPQW